MGKRRGNGEGTIFEVWIGQYISGISSDGKAIRKSVYGKTQKDGKQSFPSFLSKVKLETVLFLFCSVA